MNIDFNERAKIVHENNSKWWVDLYTGERLDRNKGELLELVLTEIAEAAEGERKNLMDDHLPTRRMAEVEMADAEIRMLDFAGGFGYEIWSDVINSLYDHNKEEIISLYKLPENKLEGLLDVSASVIQLWKALIAKENDEVISECVSEIIFSIRAYAWQHDYDIEGAYHEKNEYNKTRKDHSIEERLKENGKKV